MNLCRTKTLRVMQLTAVLLLAVCLQVSASGIAQQTVTFSGRDVPLEKVLLTVKQQTGYLIAYNTRQIRQARPVTITAQQLPLQEFLDQLLQGQPLDYVIEGNTIFIRKKEIKKPETQTPNTLVPVTGIVKGVDGKPLPNVNIQVKGTDKGTITDNDGKFNLEVNTGDVLVISSIGFGSKEITVRSIDRELVIALDISSSPLDEVQVIAYGKTTQRYSTGNISTVAATDIEKQPVSNPVLALQGRVPGMIVSQNSGVPGATLKVQIRGQNSIGYGSDPFFVVDGVPYTSQLLPNMGGAILGFPNTNGGQPGNPLSFISPDIIESITVLKDADATAIYGSRGANGVVLITTKKGKAGQTKVDLNLQQGMGKVARTLDLMNTQQYLQMRHEALANDGLIPGDFDYDLNGFWDSTRYTDWQKELIGHTALYSNVSAGVSGGTERVQYLIQTGYHRETSVFPGDLSNKNGSVAFNVNSVSENKKFRVQLGGNYLNGTNHLPSGDLTAGARYLPPNAPDLLNPDGTINWAPKDGVSTFSNPLDFLFQPYRIRSTNLIANGSIGYTILPGLEVLSTFGYSKLQTDEFQGVPLSSIRPEWLSFFVRGATYGTNSIVSWIAEPQVTYTKNIGKGKLDALVGTSIQQTSSDGLQLAASGFNSDLSLEDIHSATDVFVNAHVADLYKYNGLFARLSYLYGGRYIINLNARRDGSSRFGPADRFHNFGSIGAGWIFSEEDFFREHIPLLSYGKLRASYGTTGSDQVGNYNFMSLYQPYTVGVPYQNGTALEAIRFTNPYLQWEETKKFEVALETGLLNNRIFFNTAYFRNRSSNQLLDYTLPYFTGFGSVTRNFPATVQNAGWELTVSSKNIDTKNFTWETNVNITFTKNKLVAFPNLSTSTYGDRLIIGQPVTIRRVNHFLGVNAQTGQYEFVDSTGKPTYLPQSADRVVINPGVPDYYGGLQNSFRYKNIQLDILLQFVHQTGQNFRFGRNPGLFFSGNQPTYILDRWQHEGDIAPVQRYNGSGSINRQYDLATNSDAAYSDASYARLKNASLSWLIPERITQKAHLYRCSVYVNAQNLLTITRYKGMDPETLSSQGLPPLRVITFGIKAGL